MSKAVVIALAMLAMPALASAQGGGQRGPGGMMQQNVARLLVEKRADLALNDEQVTKLEAIGKTIEEKNAPLIEELRAARQAGADRQTMMAKMQQIRAHGDEAFEKQIKPLLSAEQVEKANRIIAEARPRRR